MKLKPAVLLPVSAIIIAETFLFLKYTSYGITLHIITLLALSLAASRIRDIEISNLLQVLALLPLFRLLNITMPIFFTRTLYIFPLVYGPIFISIYYVAKNQKFSGREIGVSFEKLHIYFPASVILGMVLGRMEYSTITVESLIPAPTFQNVLVFMVIMLIFTGLSEELLFRSMVQTRLEQAAGSMGGLIIASLLFGAMHSGYGTLYEIIFTTSAGFLIGYLFQRTRSLAFIALTHGMINIFLFGFIPLGLV
ncbi:CPBP family intramembrane glutamic endopeptidase [Candidatus Methanoperedens nitratireducens]|uniref:CAAX amino terminal protease family n=1 Tax=Candidatus Methanoperedens nitratireducens TaxID=1392998 RepID=A0A284VP82_9EURY|nr:CPBP family intramembrane glutamic endopeptidase [Candidatus Methanoperedens nitroreducens]SNQ61084.1 CAAX amino terminal protease family [Candidatus Methanoperedens nitroreducens]